MTNLLLTTLRTTFRDQSGATSVEYAIMLGMVLAACIGAITVFGSVTDNTMATNSQQISSSMSR